MNMKKNVHTCVTELPLPYSRNEHNIVNQLHLNTEEIDENIRVLINLILKFIHIP